VVVEEQPPPVVVPPTIVQPPAVVVPPQIAPAPVIIPWKLVVEDYRRIGYRVQTFTNSFGHTWTVWVSNSTGNTLLFPEARGYRGDPVGYNCLASPVANHWSQCTRYNMQTGAQDSPFLAVVVDIYADGRVDDHH